MVEHHPSLEQLNDYCSGTLPLSYGLCVATHLEYCDACRQQVKRLNQVGAVLFESLSQQSKVEQFKLQQSDKATSSGGLKREVFALLDQEPAEEVNLNAVKQQPTSVPQSLRQFIAQDYDNLNWNKISFSIKLATLLKDNNGTQIALSRTKPGGKLFHHSHTGDEITVVLKGSFSDEDGIYKQGDFIFRDAKDKHSPMVTKDSECICLMVIGSPIQFTGFFARLFNPIVRMSH